jgi:hypothetical protein
VKKQARKKNVDAFSSEGRDELNLAEFPIASLASRPSTNQKTLHFEDTVWDKGLNRQVTRRLTISASDLYGLPTSLDDEVVLGLIQMTRGNDFKEKRVFFSRYELIRLLGWRNEGKSYTRLDTSLKRWLGVTFYYENAWWDRRASAWVNESFHLLERVSLLALGRRKQQNGVEPGLCSFVWNDVVFRSFQAGYLKRVDMELFRRLKSPIAKRLYRFLDKRFHHKTTWEFDLRVLAHEHIGLSRNYDTAQLKRKLVPAIVELEENDFIRFLDVERRFARIKKGVWRVTFIKSKTKAMSPSSNATLESLLRHGVNRKTVDRLIADHSAATIKHHVKIVDWILRQPGMEKPASAAGYLVQSIRKGYDAPLEFDRSNSVQAKQSGVLSRDAKRKRRVDSFLKTLSSTERLRLEQNAMVSADAPILEAYHRAEQEQVPLLTTMYRRLMIEKHVASLLPVDRNSHPGKGRKRAGD